VRGRSWDDGTVFALQIFLENVGFSPGPIDGDWGVESVFALQRFLNYWHIVHSQVTLNEKLMLYEGDLETLKQKSLNELNDLKYTLEETLNRVIKVINEKENESESELCVVCLDEKKEYIFVPCGHYCCCEKCINKLSECPICRKIVDQKIKVFQ